MSSILEQVRDAIEASGKTRYRIWKDTGISQAMLSRLMSGERSLSIEALERLLDYLGYEIRLGETEEEEVVASITHNKKNGRRTIQFRAVDGSRRSIRLGKCDRKTAEAIRTQIEFLVTAKASGTAPPPQTTEWLKGIDESLRGRLVAVGLIASRKSAILKDYCQ